MTSETAFYKEPTHDEIALHAFLAWEKDGRPAGTGFDHWIEAERRLCAQRKKQADAAATQATRPWPPGAKTKSANETASKPALSATRERATAAKVTRPATARATRPVAAKATR
jgi:hypothetical protein